MRTRVPPQTVWSGGKSMWQWLGEDAARAADFDAAMQQLLSTWAQARL